MKTIKISVLVITFVLFLGISYSFCAGGSQGTVVQAPTAYRRDPNLNPPGVFPVNKTTVQLTVGVQQNPVIEDWKTNWMTRELERTGNFNLNFEVYAAGQLPQVFELMVMAGGADLPDVMMHTGFSLTSLTRYGEAGMIIPVNDFYKYSAHFINENLEGFDFNVFPYITSHDGNIYGLFGLNASANNELSMGRAIIYEPWLDTIILPIPQTIHEYTNVLRAFRDRDPNGNGNNDEIPFMSRRDHMITNYLYTMMTPFIFTQPGFWTNNNGRIDVAFNKPQWREGIRYTRQLVSESLLSPLSFTQDTAALNALINANPTKVGAYIGASASMMGSNDIRRTEYVILPPLSGPGGKQQFWMPSLPDIRMVITKNCKTPESAFMLGDLLGSREMSFATRWGQRGVDWVEARPDDRSLFDSLGYNAIFRAISPWGVVQNQWWAEVGPRILDSRVTGGSAFDEADIYNHIIPVGRTIAPQAQYANKNPVIGMLYTEQEQNVMDKFHQTIITYVQESFSRFAVGDLDIDRDWDRYVAEFSRMGLDRVITATQSAWDRMNK